MQLPIDFGRLNINENRKGLYVPREVGMNEFYRRVAALLTFGVLLTMVAVCASLLSA